jgi:hypothetical protein
LALIQLVMIHPPKLIAMMASTNPGPPQPIVFLPLVSA